MKKIAKAIIFTAIASSTLTGCMGRHAMTKSVEDFNLDVVENRWGREGMFILLFPVTYVTNILDLLFVNSIEFWSGTNPINNKGALVDTKVAALESMGLNNVASAQMRYLENEVLMYIHYKDGSQEVFHATRENGVYSFYRGKDLVMQATEENLKNLQAALKASKESYARLTGSTRTL